MSRPHESLVMPRGLIFLASLWLIGSWLLAIGTRPPVQPSSASYTPGVRTMLMCMAVGLMIGWPLLRLSQRPTGFPIRQTMLDLVVLLTLSQVVIWPLRLVTPWAAARTAAIDATLTGWLLVVGAIIASAVGSERRGPRNLAMFACLAACLLGPALAWIGVITGLNAITGVQVMDLIDLGPIMAIRTLGEGGGSAPTADQWRWILLLAVTAVAAWSVLGMLAVIRARRDRRGDGPPRRAATASARP